MLLGEPSAIERSENINETVENREREIAQVAKPKLAREIKEEIIEVISGGKGIDTFKNKETSF